MTREETQDLVRAAVILLAASLLRYGWSLRPSPPLLDHLPEVGAQLLQATDALAGMEEEARRPLAPGERVDPNRAGEAQLRRLPGVGPAMARRILDARASEGGFRGPEDLLSIPGVGPATLARLEPLLDFSGGIPPELPGRRGGGGDPGGEGRIPVNRAGELELQRLPGVGPALARRIVEHRIRVGGFRTLEDLLAVPGVGPATLERLRPLVDLRP